MGTDWSPVGQIYFFTLHSTNPAYDPMELKSIEDWIVEKNFKAVPDVVDVSSFGGPTREYQVRVDPNKLVAYGLSLAQVEQQLANNNGNAGGSFIQEGLQQINVRSVGLVDRAQDIERTVILTKNGTPLRVKDIAVVSQGPKIRLGQFARAIHREDGKIIDNDDVVSGIVLLRKDAAADTALARHSQKSGGVESSHPASRGKDRSVHRSQRSGALHLSYRAAQPYRRHDPGFDHSVSISRQCPRRAYCCSDHPVFAAVCVNLFGLEPHSRQPPVAWGAGFWHGGRWRRGHDRKHRAPFARDKRQRENSGAEQSATPSHEVQRPVFYAIAIIITAYLPIFTLQRVEGRLFHPMAWTVAFALLGALLFSILIAPVLASFAFAKGAQEWRNPVMHFLTERYRVAVRWAIRHRMLTVGVCLVLVVFGSYLAFGGAHRLRISAPSG